MEPRLTGPVLSHRRRPYPAVRGLTLIELTMVLLVMAVIASFSVPRLMMITEVNLRTSARNLTETLGLLSSLAITHSRPYGILYDLDKQRYCYVPAREDPETGGWHLVFADEKDETVSDPLVATRCFPLKDGVYFKDIETPEAAEAKQEKGRLTHSFSPRGIAESLVIHLGDKKGRYYSIFLQRYGGRVELREGTWSYKQYVEDMLR
ncbi:MAG: prepilin-type N-terminal cleavage/methylation domain-containing protein [bacterium]